MSYVGTETSFARPASVEEGIEQRIEREGANWSGVGRSALRQGSGPRSEQRRLNRLPPAARPGGFIIADSIGMAPDYAKAITTTSELEPVFFGEMSITLEEALISQHHVATSLPSNNV